MMRMRGGDPRCAPPWWPANEPWPPRRGSEFWRRGRRRYMRGMLIFLIPTFLIVAMTVSWTIVSLVRHLGGPAGIDYAAPLVAWMLFMFAFVFGVRRVGTPVSDIVGAAERVANGDFSARVAPRGPRFVRTVASAFNTMTERLDAHDRQRRELMADIAHELRTPLTVIQGRLEGLLDGVYPLDHERLTGVLDETRLLARLVEDLRTLANAETGILSLQKEPTDLLPLIQDVVHALAADARPSVTVHVNAPPELAPVNIDPLRIREVIANLLSNALRYTPDGGAVTISVRQGNGGVTIDVSDTGAGIPPADLAKIFDRFYKGSTSRGSGLGLTIARNLVAAHGGTIRAESEPGRGTAITFDLPF